MHARRRSSNQSPLTSVFGTLRDFEDAYPSDLRVNIEEGNIHLWKYGYRYVMIYK